MSQTPGWGDPATTRRPPIPVSRPIRAGRPGSRRTRLDRAGQPPEREQPAAGRAAAFRLRVWTAAACRTGSHRLGMGAPQAVAGVIPLRPLGVGEILDGAVTTIRRNPGRCSACPRSSPC